MAHEWSVSFRAFSGYFAPGGNRAPSPAFVHLWFSRFFPKCASLRGIGIRAMELIMKKFAKLALGALMVVGAVAATTAVTTTSAEARTGFSFSFGSPGYYGGYYGPA